MRSALAPALLTLLSACAGPLPVAPDAAALGPAEREAYGVALRALIEDDPGGAVAEIEALTRREPWYVPAHVVYQDALTAHGHGDQLRHWYRAEADLAADDAARVLMAGRLTPRADGQREAAYRRAVLLDATSPWPSLALAYELTRSAGEAAAQAVLQADRGYPVEAGEAESRARAGHAEADAIVARLLVSHPRVGEIHAAAANVALTHGLATGDRESVRRAAEHAEDALALDPARPRWWVLLARVRRELIDDRGAETALRKALDLAPDDPGLHASLGRVLLDLGRPEEAREVLAWASEARPDDAAIATDLGVAYHRTEQLDFAVSELERAARLAPDDPRPVEALALVELDAGRNERAAAAAREYLRRGGSDRASAERILRELELVELPPPE